MKITQEVLDNMPLHTSVGYMEGHLSIEILRVSGGWIYRISNPERTAATNTTFVPETKDIITN